MAQQFTRTPLHNELSQSLRTCQMCTLVIASLLLPASECWPCPCAKDRSGILASETATIPLRGQFQHAAIFHE